jgi:hypothetical protein
MDKYHIDYMRKAFTGSQAQWTKVFNIALVLSVTKPLQFPPKLDEQDDFQKFSSRLLSIPGENKPGTGITLLPLTSAFCYRALLS